MTKEDVFKRLDKRLSKDERLSLAKAHELSDYHFGLGIWIRNNWFGKEEISSLFCDEVTFNGEDGMLFLPLLADRDIFSEKVLCEYQKYLREKYNVTEEEYSSGQRHMQRCTTFS